jgi:phosphate starvation-inducible PhoH-like protein
VGKQLDRKKSRNSRQYGARQHGDAEIIEFKGSKFQNARVLPPIKALNSAQSHYLAALRSSQQIVVLGPAGTGKTWIAATHAADLYRTGRIDKIILTRPRRNSLPGRFPSSTPSRSASATAPMKSRSNAAISKWRPSR